MQLFAKRFCRAAKDCITVSNSFLLSVAGAFLIIPLQWLGAWALAFTAHELFHYIALRLCGETVTGIHIGCRGCVMKTNHLTLGKEAFCAYAGPLGGLLVLLFARHVPRTAICTFLLSTYNLLPIVPLDGGRGLDCLLRRFFSAEVAQRVLRCVEIVVILGILTVSVYAVVWLGLGIVPAAIAIILILRSKRIKFPCKMRPLGLQ